MKPAFCAEQYFSDDLAHLIFQKAIDPVFRNEHELGVHVSHKCKFLFLIHCLPLFDRLVEVMLLNGRSCFLSTIVLVEVKIFVSLVLSLRKRVDVLIPMVGLDLLNSCH